MPGSASTVTTSASFPIYDKTDTYTDKVPWQYLRLRYMAADATTRGRVMTAATIETYMRPQGDTGMAWLGYFGADSGTCKCVRRSGGDLGSAKDEGDRTHPRAQVPELTAAGVSRVKSTALTLRSAELRASRVGYRVSVIELFRELPRPTGHRPRLQVEPASPVGTAASQLLSGGRRLASAVSAPMASRGSQAGGVLGETAGNFGEIGDRTTTAVTVRLEAELSGLPWSIDETVRVGREAVRGDSPAEMLRRRGSHVSTVTLSVPMRSSGGVLADLLGQHPGGTQQSQDGGGIYKDADDPQAQLTALLCSHGVLRLTGECATRDAFDTVPSRRLQRAVRLDGSQYLADGGADYWTLSDQDPGIAPEQGVDGFLRERFFGRMGHFITPVFPNHGPIAAISPCSDVAISFGYRRPDGSRHAAIDYRYVADFDGWERNRNLPFPVRSIGDGVVVAVYRTHGLGNQVLVQYVGPPILRVRYAHLTNGRARDLAFALTGGDNNWRRRAQAVINGTAPESQVQRWGTDGNAIRVEAGQTVRAGQLIGWAGATGDQGQDVSWSPNVHLHLNVFTLGWQARDGHASWYYVDPYGIYQRPSCYRGLYPRGSDRPADLPQHPSIFMRLFSEFGDAAPPTLAGAEEQFGSRVPFSRIANLCPTPQGNLCGSFSVDARRENVLSHVLVTRNELEARIAAGKSSGYFPSQIRGAETPFGLRYTLILERLPDGLGADDVYHAVDLPFAEFSQKYAQRSGRRAGWTMVDYSVIRGRGGPLFYTGTWLRFRRWSSTAYTLTPEGFREKHLRLTSDGFTLWRMTESHRDGRPWRVTALWRNDLPFQTTYLYSSTRNFSATAADYGLRGRIVSLTAGDTAANSWLTCVYRV